MKAAAAVAEILKREGVEFLIGYPVNPIIEAAAEADIRTIIVRQERTGLHMADAVSRVTLRPDRSACSPCSTARAPRTPSAAWPRPTATRCRSSCCPAATRASSPTSRRTSTRSSTTSTSPSGASRSSLADAVPDAMRRAFTQVQNGRPRPVLVEIPGRRLSARRCPSRSTTRRRRALRIAPRPAGGRPRSPRVLVAAERPVIYAGQGVHYAQAWPQLRELAELLEAPVTTSLAGQERLPREPPAVARLGRPLDPEAGPPLPAATPTSSSASAAASRTTNYGVADAEGQDDHPRHARPGRPQQGRRRPSTR